ncbi:MAG: glycosyltransferase [Pseudomonadota bacterium]
MISTSFPSKGDGSEAAGAFAADLAVELGRHIPVRVVAPGTHACRERFATGVEVYRFAAPDKPLSALSLRSPHDIAWMGRVLMGGQAATRAAVGDAPTAHQLALWALPSGHWARRVSRSAGVPYSVWTLGSDIWTLGKVPLVKRYLRSVIAGATCVFSDGFGLARETEALGGRTVEFLASARSLDVVERPEAGRGALYSLLFIGRWHPNKGVDLLMDALTMLGERDWARIRRVVICGGGPMADAVLSAAERLRSQGRPVEMRGYVGAAEAAHLIGDADYLLIPSRIESIPVVFSDAIRNGCPVVTMPVGDLPRLVEGECTGIMAARVSAEAFAAALGRALATSPSIFTHGMRRLAPVFSVQEGIAPRILALVHGSPAGRAT